MPGPNYTVIPGDWNQLEIIINDLSSRVLTADIDTQTLSDAISSLSALDVTAVSDMASANSDAISAVSNLAQANSTAIDSAISHLESAISDLDNDSVGASATTDIDTTSSGITVVKRQITLADGTTVSVVTDVRKSTA